MDKWMIVIAGPNGAGKTTFYRDVMLLDPILGVFPFINVDIIAQDIPEILDTETRYFEAGKIALNAMKQNLQVGKSFIYETTSAGKGYFRHMEDAKQAGFRVATIFIGLSNVKLSYLRVVQRMLSGGHNVRIKDVIRRYPRILKNLPKLLQESDVSGVFDNSKENPFKLIFLANHEKILVYHPYPNWLKKALKNCKTKKNIIHMHRADCKKMNFANLYFLSSILTQKMH